LEQIHPAQAVAGPGEGGVALENVLVLAGHPAHLTGEMDLLPGPLGCGLFVGEPQEEHSIGVGEFALQPPPATAYRLLFQSA
jgi:hypothetical protein